jgi:hypothetical protein
MSMTESSTYQALFEEGFKEGAVLQARKILRMQGTDAFGPPDARADALIERLDLVSLEEAVLRTLTAKSWQEVLGQPPCGPRGRRRRRAP